jgi:hypothetical protein
MFGFVKADKSEKEKRSLGGEIFREKQRNMRIFWIISGTVVFIVFNVILYLISKY